MRRNLKTIATACALLLSLLASSPATTTDPDIAILQEAVDAYAAIGVTASCATYVTVNQGGTVTNHACAVSGSDVWHDARLVVAMNPAQLQADIKTNSGGSAVTIDPGDTIQVTGTVSLPTSSPGSSTSTSTGSSGSAIASTAAGAAVAIGGGLLSMMGIGVATEVTQILNNAALGQQLAKMVSTYNRITDQYNHMIFQAKYMKGMGGRYSVMTVPWRGMATTNTYGTSGGWIGAVNTGLNTLAAWESATVRPMPYRGGFTSLPPSQLARKQIDYSTLELQDGAAVSTMSTIGSIRANGPKSESTIANLEGDALADNADMQTLAAQMNKANALAVIQAKQTANQNKLLVANAEMALLRMKKERDAEAYALQNDVIFRSESAAFLDAEHRDASATIAAYRMP